MSSGPLDGVREALARLGFEVDVEEDELRLDLSDTGNGARHLYLKAVELTEELGLLTFSTDYEFSFEPPALGDAFWAAHELTMWLPLGSFQVEDDGSVHLRYALPLGAAPTLDEALLKDVVSLLDYCQLHFGDYLAQLASGKVAISAFGHLVQQGEEFAQEFGLV